MAEHSPHVGVLIFDGVDQIDVTGPFEVLSRLPGATVRLYGRTAEPVRDANGLRLSPDGTLADAPTRLDILHVPGGPGQESLMDDGPTLDWLASSAEQAGRVLSVCTGALLCGAAGLLRGRRATTHWSAIHLLPYFGATAVDERVVVDGRLTFAAGVTAGIDGALQLAADLCGPDVAQRIQLQIEYDPRPPFRAGTPSTAPSKVLARARADGRRLAEARLTTARRVADRLGVVLPTTAT